VNAEQASKMLVVGADPLSERGRPLPLELHNRCSRGPAGVMAMARDKGRDTQSREIHTGVLLRGNWRPVRERPGRVEVGEARSTDEAG
jgi:hypothetical protein